MTEAELGSGNLICAVAFDGGWSGRTQMQGYGRLVWSLYLRQKQCNEPESFESKVMAVNSVPLG